MDLTQKLIELLNRYIKENKNLKEDNYQKRTNQTLYEELITTLKNQSYEEAKMVVPVLLNTIYGNNIYVDEFYNIMTMQNHEEELKKFITKLENEYNELKAENYRIYSRIIRNKEIVSSAKRARESLFLQTKILDSKNDIFNVKKIIKYYGIAGVISNKEELLLINEIETYNRKVATKYGPKIEQEYVENLYNEIPNILTIGFQEQEEIEVAKERKNTLDNFANEIINLINHIEKEQIIELLENYQRYNLETNEYNYIIVKVLNSYLDDLITLYSLLLEKEIYTYRKQRIDVVREYYAVLERYITIVNYYNKITEYIPEDESDEEVEEETNNISHEEKRLIYVHSDINIKKSRLISDMSDVPYEYYEDIYDLITRFKNGTSTKEEIKKLKNHKKFREYQELRDDQVRIVFKHIKENIYIILGVFVKKDNNDPAMYGRIINRRQQSLDTEEKINIELELAKHTEEELEKLVKEKSRKNSR